MTADCADYETYRSGKYVPGLMGTLFSFIDKLVSSLAPMIASLCLSAIGFKEAMPDLTTPFTPQLKIVGIFLMYGQCLADGKTLVKRGIGILQDDLQIFAHLPHLRHGEPQQIASSVEHLAGRRLD